MPETSVMVAKTAPSAIASWWGLTRDFTAPTVVPDRGRAGTGAQP